MLAALVCGGVQPEEELDPKCCSPKKSTRKSSSFGRSSNKSSKNPYSTIGLDKFEALCADLEEKKQKIYTQKGADEISLVRFKYTSSNNCVPIVVKSKDRKQDGNSKAINEITEGKRSSDTLDDKFPIETLDFMQETKNSTKAGSDKQTGKIKSIISWNLITHQLRKPSYYMPAFLILILLFLAFFGRSVAILCTSIGWYMVPMLRSSTSSTSHVRKSGKKKELMRRYSDNKMVTGDKKRKSSPRSSGHSSPDISPQHHGHQKSW